MSSPHNAEVPKSSDTTSCSDIFRFDKMRSIATVAKTVVRKIKSVGIFRSRSSTFHVQEAGYSGETRCGTDIANLEFDEDGQQTEKGIVSKVLQTTEGAEVHAKDGNDILPSAELGKAHVGGIPISTAYSTYEGYCANEGRATDLSRIDSPPDATTVKEMKRLSHELRSHVLFESPCKASDTPSNVLENMNMESIAKQAVPSSDYDIDAMAKEKSIDTTFEISLQAQPVQTGQDAKSDSSHLSSETFDTVISNNVFKTEACETKNTHDEINSESVSESQLQSPTFGLDHIQTESFDLATSDTTTEGPSSAVGVQNDRHHALTTTEMGYDAVISCRTAENVADDFEQDQDMKGNDPKELISSDIVLKPELPNPDPENYERNERRKKLLAKKEAQLLKLIKYTASEAEKTRIRGSRRAGLKSPHIGWSTIVAAASVASKNESNITHKTEKDSERARWSKKEAREARERRMHNQKERLLNLMEICMLKN